MAAECTYSDTNSNHLPHPFPPMHYLIWNTHDQNYSHSFLHVLLLAIILKRPTMLNI